MFILEMIFPIVSGQNKSGLVLVGMSLANWKNNRNAHPSVIYCQISGDHFNVTMYSISFRSARASIAQFVYEIRECLADSPS